MFSIDKGSIHHKLVVLKHLKYWLLFLLLAVFLAINVYSLRQNSIGMTELREQVKAADESGKNIAKSISNLQNYVAAHMNTEGNTVYLEHSHQRAYDAKVAEAVAKRNPNSKRYDQAHTECKAKFPTSFFNYTNCAHEKLGKLASGQDALASLKAPPAEAFTYNFISPKWTADLAGISLVLTGVVAIALTLKIVLTILFVLLLKSKHKHLIG